MTKVTCATCKKVFSSKSYLKQHFAYKKNRRCMEEFMGEKDDESVPSSQAVGTSNNNDSSCSNSSGNKRPSPSSDQVQPAAKKAHTEGAIYEAALALYEEVVAEDAAAREQIAGASQYDKEGCARPLDEEEGGCVTFMDDEESNVGPTEEVNEDQVAAEAAKDDNNAAVQENNAHVAAGEGNSVSTDSGGEVNTELLDQFQKYCDWADNNLCDLSADDQACVELLHILSKRRVPLGLYQELFKWHVRNINATEFIPQRTLVPYLSKRYNMDQTKPKMTKTIELPSSKARIQMVVHDAAAQIQSLLTDPRIKDEDYLFFDNNPFAGPPEADPVVIKDINTGRAYRKSWQKYIKEPEKEVLLPIIWYLDEAVAGNFGSLPVEALKFTLGIFNGKTRDKEYAWRNVGYVAHYLSEDTTGKDILKKSDNIDAKMYLSSQDFNEAKTTETILDVDNESEDSEENIFDMNNLPAVDESEKVEIPESKPQDLHSMIDCLLSSFKELQKKGGILWDLRYRGETYRVKFVPFTLFIKGDTVEHDKMCGSYTSRTQHVKQLCRYCCIPNEETDEPYKNYERKSQKMMEDLLKEKKEEKRKEGLRALSQQYIKNCWYDIRFGAHNDYGVHGATPVEPLHWIELGKFKNTRDNFFKQTGESSKLTKDIDSLARCMGHLYKRQSLSNVLPRTSFNKGILKGHLQAHEYTGLMVILATVLRSSKGRSILVNNCRDKDS